jgi:hypothetical protein
VVAVSLIACAREECKFLPSETPSVFVIDDETHTPVCDAVVHAYDGDYDEVATPPLHCAGIYTLSGRGGDYTITATAPGYEPKAETARIVDLDCGYEVEKEGPRGGYPGFAYTVTLALARESAMYSPPPPGQR